MIYTRGPWKYCGVKNCKCGLIWSIPADAVVATTKFFSDDSLEFVNDEEEFLGNGQLVAKAPEMYEAINNFITLLENPQDAEQSFNECIERFKQCL